MSELTKGRKISFPKNIGPNLTKHVLPWVETFWHAKKRYPTDGEFCDRFGWTLQEVELLHHSKFYDNCLRSRGISRHNSGDLTERQVAAISLITNFSDTRSSDIKMASIGVTPEELNGWYSNSIFQRELAARADAILDNVFPEAQAQLARQIKRGSFPALKFYYEITGRAQSPEAVNIKLAMTRLIEAVQKHVHDPAVLQAIANEMNAVAPAVAVEPVQTRELSLAEKYAEFQNDIL